MQEELDPLLIGKLMLTISDCKKILGQVQEEEQVKEIRDTLYQLAELLIAEFKKQKISSIDNNTNKNKFLDSYSNE